MMTADAGVLRRCAAQASKVRGVCADRCRSLMRSTAVQSAGATSSQKVGSGDGVGMEG